MSLAVWRQASEFAWTVLPVEHIGLIAAHACIYVHSSASTLPVLAGVAL
jgi:hypothetical protein